MDQSRIERDLVRCRYLINRAAAERLGLRDIEAVKSSKDAFICECHSVFKKARDILISDVLEIEDWIERLTGEDGDSLPAKKHRYWLRVLESCYESFLWLRFAPSDVHEIYKARKDGSLKYQNVSSVLEVTQREDKNPYVFTVPLDFTRFSCIADLLRFNLHPDAAHIDFIEVKRGLANEALFDAMESKSESRWQEFFDKFGEKGIGQAQRFFRQMEVSFERGDLIGGRTGTYKRGKGKRMVVASGTKPRFFTAKVEELCQKARRGEYATEALDSCLLLGALDTTSNSRYAVADFDVRLLVWTAFLDARKDPEHLPGDLVDQLQRIEFIDWRESFGSIFLMPLLLRDISTRSFLDILFGRIRLVFYFHPPGFLDLCRSAGVRAGFIREKATNRIRSVLGLNRRECPTFDGRAVGYFSGDIPMLMASQRIHEMAFNWILPSSVVDIIASSNFQAVSDPSAVPDESLLFRETDLEC